MRQGRESISRRRFLAEVGAAGVAGVAGPLLRPQVALAADAAAGHTLVVVVLEGGLDGISALVPAGDPAYSRHRRLTRVEAGLRPVDATFGLHPALAPLYELWSSGLVAAVPATGTAAGTRSHFAALAAVADGAEPGWSDGSGWLARHLVTRSGAAPVTLQGISLGDLPALELRGHTGAFHFRNLARVGVGGWDPAAVPGVEAALATAYAGAPPDLAEPAAVAFDAVARMRSVDLPPVAGVDPWSGDLSQVAALVRAGIGTEAAVVPFGSFDTHSAQGGSDGHLAVLLGRLARALHDLFTALQDQLDQLTVVVLSEFGRRAAENGSGGTDHGRGGLALVLGGGLNGGVHGPWPGLDDAALDQGDVAVATDIRSVLAEVVRSRLGNAALDQVFPGFTPVPIGFA